jgi:hypothetical protein
MHGPAPLALPETTLTEYILKKLIFSIIRKIFESNVARIFYKSNQIYSTYTNDNDDRYLGTERTTKQTVIF